MKSRLLLVSILGASILGASAVIAQTPPAHIASTGGKSPHETVSAVIGDRRTGNRVTLTYGRPYTADPKSGQPRKIWGELVPWGKAYRLGADEATLLITQKPLVFGETTIPAGAYTLYHVPVENGASKLVFSNALGKWGVPVDETHDVARVDLKKTTLDQPVEQLTLGIQNDAATGGGVLTIRWETTEFSVPFTVGK
jgi:hypothetical protein